MTITLDGTTGITTPGLTNTGTETIATLSVSGAVTLSGGTANGVGYLNGSKVLTTGSALTFDGTYLGVGRAVPTVALDIYNAAPQVRVQGTGTSSEVRLNAAWAGTALGAIGTVSNDSFMFYVNNTESMRLTSTGLGIGTSSPNQKLAVIAANPTNGYVAGLSNSQGTAGRTGTYLLFDASSLADYKIGIPADVNAFAIYDVVAAAERMRIDSSGNLGIGTSSPAAKLHVQGAVGSLAALFSDATNYTLAIARSGATGSVGMLYGTSGSSLALGANGTEAARIDTSGNLGLGVTPSAWGSGVKVVQVSNYAAVSSSGAYGGSYSSNSYYDGTNWKYITTDSATKYDQVSGKHAWYNAASGTAGNTITFTQAMTLDASGNLLVGTTSVSPYPTQGLSIYGNNGGSSLIGMGHATGTASGNGYMTFAYNGTGIGSITQSGTTAVLYNVTSDRRLKDNITDADSASDLIDAIKVRQFDWKSDGSHQRYGMIAQELHEVAPEAVHSPADPDDMMAVDYSKLVPMLVKEIQSLRVRLNALESK